MKNPFNQSSELKQKLEISERKFRTVAETATDAIIIADESGTILFTNSKTKEIFGYTSEELNENTIDSILAPDLRDIHHLGIKRFLGEGQQQMTGRMIELQATKKNGFVFPIEVSLSYWVEKENYFYTFIIRDVTQRKKEEKILRENEERFRLIADYSSDVISVHELDGTIKYISPSSEYVMGYKPEELIGTIAYNLYHPEDLIKMQQAYSEVVDIPDITTVSFRCRKKDGTYIWLESTARTIRNENGEPFEIHAANRDITQRKIAEEKLKESQHFIERITDASPILISLHDLMNHSSIYANKELTEILGYRHEDIRKMGVDAMALIVHPDDLKVVKERNSKLSSLKDGEIFEAEVRVKHSNGTYRWMQAKTVVFKRTPEGKVWQTLSISLDITAKKHAEEALKKAQQELQNLNKELENKVNERTDQLHQISESLKQSEAQLKIITNTLPAFISYIDKNQIYRYTNEFYTNLNSNIGSPVGKSVREVLGEEMYSNSKHFIDKALQGESSLYVLQMKLKDGSDKDIEVRYIPDKDENGKVRGLVVMGIDLTERAEYEKRLNRKNRELKKINNDLDNFIYTASHDLKAPIANIEGLIIAIHSSDEYEKVPQEIKELFDLIDTSVIKFKNTIIDLTEISKAQRSFEEREEDVLLEDIIDETRFLIQDLIKSTHTKFIINLSIPVIRFSKRNLRSIIYNLLSNAVKYRSPLRTPLIEITSSEKDNSIVLSVKDNGLGIEEEKKEKIFKMFKRMHDHVEGTGVGLYIVKRIVDNSGGKIIVDSIPGQGSIFHVYFPKK